MFTMNLTCGVCGCAYTFTTDVNSVWDRAIQRGDAPLCTFECAAKWDGRAQRRYAVILYSDAARGISV